MGYTIKKNIKIAAKKEAIEGTYEAPTAADFIQAQEDGIEMNGAKDTLEINTIGMGLSKSAPRVGLESATGSIPVYMKAGSAPNAEPEYGVLLESLMGSKRSSATPETSGIGHTTTVITFADTSPFKVGDVVVVSEAGAFHTSPIASITTNTSITLLVAMGSAPSDNVDVEAFTTYVPTDDSHPSFSVSKWVEDEVLEQSVGCKTTSMTLESFSTGQVASLKLGFEGANYTRSLSTLATTPSYDTSETPIILDACIYQNGVKIEVNDFSMSVENTLGWIKDTCNGKQTSRVTGRSISGSINPYKQDNDISDYTRFDSNSSFSLFITAHNPGSTGEYAENMSFYMPECTITELGESDIDGVLTEAISFTANSADGTVKELYISIS